ncbi:MAG TPA: hypothetical protein VHL99_00170 [Candidatus Binatia bacterium]|jgi:hypothetical protein|nr:hypothetical protein [Candidatus Binatia bacterium]
MDSKILLGLVLVALAIVFHALSGRYDVIAVSDSEVSAIYRVDRLTGKLWICANDQCLPVQDIDKKQAGQRT